MNPTLRGDSLFTQTKLALVNMTMIWVGGLVLRICGINVGESTTWI